MQITRAPRRHLEASELIDCTGVCPICLADGPRRPVFRLQANPDVAMLACANCGACSASHMPRPEVLENYYGQYYASSDRAVTFPDAQRFARHVVNGLPGNALPRAVRILDFGGGDGSLSRAIAERLIARDRVASAEILVVDFVTREVAAMTNIDVRFQSPSEPLHGQYDLVLASAILEHVPDLHRLLTALYATIVVGGVFYARTPYSIPLTKLFPGLDLTYPAHVHDMGSPFWDRLPETFAWSVRVLVSRPSLVAGRLRDDLLRAAAAMLLKLPAHVENLLLPVRRARRFWHLVGGWEILLQRV